MHIGGDWDSWVLWFLQWLESEFGGGFPITF